MSLKNKNNPLGQHIPSDHVGATNPAFKHGQSAKLVEEIKQRAAQMSRDKDAEDKKRGLSRNEDAPTKKD